VSDLPLNITDIVIIVVVVGSALLALINGLVRSVLSLAGWIGAALVTFWSLDLVTPYARSVIGDFKLDNNIEAAAVVAGVTVFLVTLVVLTLVAAAAGNAMRRSSLSALDRTLGLVFGLARGVVLMALAYLAISAVEPPAGHPPWIKQARALPVIQASATWLWNMAPPRLRARLGVEISDADRQVQRDRDAQRAMQIPPRPPANSPATPGQTGYKNEDRRGLERLLQANEPAPPPPPSQVTR
jgi:membrane protein required for colicin V production